MGVILHNLLDFNRKIPIFNLRSLENKEESKTYSIPKTPFLSDY